MKKNTKNYLIKKLNDFYTKNNKVPTCLDLTKTNNMPDRSVFENKFGCFNNALIESGLEINKSYRRWKKEEIIKSLQIKYGEIGYTPGIRDFDNDPNMPGKNTVRNMFGNWTNALRIAKIPVKRFRSKKELIKILQNFAKELGRTPTREEISTANIPIGSYTPFIKKFGSYTAACLQAGLIPNDGRNNNIWKGWQNHCEEMAKAIYKNIKIQNMEGVDGIPDILIPSEKLIIEAKTCGYKDFKEQIKKYQKNKYRIEFWLIFKGIETKRINVSYIYADELAQKMKNIGREDLSARCYQFINNIYHKDQTTFSKTI